MKIPHTKVEKVAQQLKEWANEKGLGMINWEHVAKRLLAHRKTGGDNGKKNKIR